MGRTPLPDELRDNHPLLAQSAQYGIFSIDSIPTITLSRHDFMTIMTSTTLSLCPVSLSYLASCPTTYCIYVHHPCSPAPPTSTLVRCGCQFTDTCADLYASYGCPARSRIFFKPRLSDSWSTYVSSVSYHSSFSRTLSNDGSSLSIVGVALLRPHGLVMT